MGCKELKPLKTSIEGVERYCEGSELGSKGEGGGQHLKHLVNMYEQQPQQQQQHYKAKRTPRVNVPTPILGTIACWPEL